MKSKWITVLWVLIALVLLIELVRDVFFMSGDFIGYVQVGNLTIQGDYIYQNPAINTWPPFFSIASVPVAALDNLNGYLSRFVWLAGSLWALYMVFRYMTALSLGRSLSLLPLSPKNYITKERVHVQHGLILITLLIMLKYVMDNMSNIQINIFMLCMAMASIWFFSKGKVVLGALILGFSISLKVYTVFLLAYFIIKREFKFVGWTLLFIVLFGSVPFAVYGWEETLAYYAFWYEQNVVPFAFAHHANQSFFSMMRCYLSHSNPGEHGGEHSMDLYVNFANLSVDQVKKVCYGVLAVAGLTIAYFFRNKLQKKTGLSAFAEYALVISCIPLLSPLAWKAYFIFLLPAYFISVLHIYYMKDAYSNGKKMLMKILFFSSIILTVFTSDLFVGPRVSDILEAYSAITFGAILINISVLFIFFNTKDEMELKTTKEQPIES